MTTNQHSLRLNRHLFTATGTDSGALNVLGTIVHQFPDEGDYVIEVSRDDELVGRRLLVVSDEYHAVQADVDLSAFATATNGDPIGGTDDCGCGSPCTCEDQEYICIREDGFVVFYVARGPGGYTVVVDPVGERREAREFESTELTEVDTFAAVLLRPGTYVVRNLATNHEGSVEVTYPDPDRGPEAKRESVAIDCTDDGFEPDAVELHPAQGLVFSIATPSRIEIALDEPHENAAADTDSGAVRLRNPRRPGISDRGRKLEPRIDPGEFSVDDLERELASITNPLELHAVLAIERRTGNRSSAIESITDRLRELQRNRRTGSDDE